MRYRQLDANGDYVFGGNSAFLVNTPETVAQAVLTRISLLMGEWFLDNTVGLDLNQIVGAGTENSRDLEIQNTVLDTDGVTQLLGYVSAFNHATRLFSVSMEIDTIYGATTLTTTL